jgi:hypothetical protein
LLEADPAGFQRRVAALWLGLLLRLGLLWLGLLRLELWLWLRLRAWLHRLLELKEGSADHLLGLQPAACSSAGAQQQQQPT